jgi:hypothetical protein
MYGRYDGRGWIGSLHHNNKKKEKLFLLFRSLAKKFLDCFNPVKLHLAPQFYYVSKLFITLHHPCKNEQGIGHGLGIIE